MFTTRIFLTSNWFRIVKNGMTPSDVKGTKICIILNHHWHCQFIWLEQVEWIILLAVKNHVLLLLSSIVEC